MKNPPFALEPASEPATMLRSVFRNLGWMLASRGVLAVLSLAYLAIATRTLGLADFGRFSLVVGAAQTVFAIAGFQTWQIIIQYGIPHLQAGDEARLDGVMRAAGLLDALSAVVGLAVAALILTIWHDALGIGPDLATGTMVFTAAQLLSIRSTPLGVLRMREQFSLAAAADSMTPIVRLIGAGAAAIFAPTVEAFLMAWAAAEVLTASAYWFALWWIGDLRRLAGRPHVRRVIADNPRIVRFSFTTNLISSLDLSSKQVPLLLTGAFVGNAGAGEFRLAAQLASALTKLSQLLSRAAFPEIVRAVGGSGIGEMGRFVRRSIWLSSGFALVAFLLILLSGRAVLMLLGDKHGGAYPILLWLAAAGCVNFVTVGSEPLLMAAHRTGALVVIRLIGTALLFATALALAPMLGTVGMGIAALVNAAAVALMLVVMLIGLSGRQPNAGPEPTSAG